MENQFNYITISSISKPKGIYDFAKIAKNMKKTHSKDRFIWIGTGEIPNDIECNNDIQFLRFLSDKQKYNFLYGNTNTIFILCSHHEGFSLPISEACLFEIPVLAYKIPELFSVYKDNINYVQCFNINEFTSKLIEMRENYSTFKKKSITAKQYIIKNFSSDVFIKKMRSIMEDEFIEKIPDTGIW